MYFISGVPYPLPAKTKLKQKTQTECNADFVVNIHRSF